jgi:heat shock protein HslJ
MTNSAMLPRPVTLAALACAWSIGLAACAPPTPIDPTARTPQGKAPTPQATGTQSWFIAAVGGVALDPAATRMRPTLEIGADRVSGHAGCNSYSGQLAQQSDRPAAAANDPMPPWLAGPLATTRLMCEPAAMAVERSITTALQRATVLARVNGGAELQDSQGTALMALVPIGAPITTEGPAGRVWQLVSIDGAPTNPDRRPTLEIANGRASGNAGCNQFGGAFTLAGDRFNASAGPMTMRACVEADLNATEAAFMGALWGSGTWRIAGNTLTLAGARATLVFESH